MSSASHNDLSSIEKFDGTNFNTWKFKIKALLMSKRAWAAVAESDKDKSGPAVDDEAEMRAFSTLAMSIKDSQLPLIMSCKTAKC